MPLAAVNCAPPTLIALTNVAAELSSSNMTPVAAAVAMVVPALGADSVTVKPSLGSTVVSPATLMVMSWLVWPAAKLTVPVGNTPPSAAKSAALAGLAPLPETVQVADDAPVVLPERVTVKVNGVLPVLPSALLAAAAAIAKEAPPPTLNTA